MARKPTGNPVGRPEKPINWDQFEQLCALQCSTSEIASFLYVCEDTLYNRVRDEYDAPYTEIYKKFAEAGKCSLRRNQFALSKTNASMAIWLGKQWLGQKDISKEEVKDIAGDLINAVREIQADSRVSDDSKSIMETQQSLLHKKSEWPENKIPC